MSRKKSKKVSSANDELDRLLASHEERYSTWHRYNELGGSDPTWPDGANMNLVRNHMGEDFEDWEMYQLRQRVKLVQEFDKLCDDKREYPALLKAELDAMIQAYPEDRRFKEDLRMYLRLFGRK